MIFWALVAGLSALAVGLLAPPLLRRGGPGQTRASYDLTVYRDQLSEIERDLDRGVLNPDQAGAARNEIERRMLRAAQSAAPGASPGTRDHKESGGHKQPAGNPERRSGHLGRGTRGLAAAIVLGLPAAALALYLALGSPGEPGRAFAERGSPAMAENRGAAGAGAMGEVDRLAEGLAKRLAAEPDNRDGWLLLGRTYMETRRFDKAIGAYSRAIAFGLDGAEMRAGLGEAFVSAAGGMVGPEARRAFAAALETDPHEPRALYYSGLDHAQNGRAQEAIETWTEMLRRAPPEATWRPVVAEQIRQAAASLGAAPPEIAVTQDPVAQDPVARDPVERPAVSGPAMARRPAPGPSAAEVRAAAEMSTEERAVFIRSMVERLASRLEEEPADFDGWLRLARAYGVLGEAGQAEAALDRAAKLVRDLPAGAPERATLDQAKRALPAAR